MYEDPTQCSGGIATPRRPPTGLTLDQLTWRSTPLTFVIRDLTNRRFHLVMIGQPIGTLENKVWAKPTIRFPPSRPNVAVFPFQVSTASPSMKESHSGAGCRVFAPATTILETIRWM
ncbi:hypothetical protein VPH35_005446 [Triticum aestivum]